MDARTLVIMGSGETTPTMVTVHQRILAALGDDPDAVLLDTPYGFQENASEITERALGYFRTNVGHEVRAVELRRPSDAGAAAVESALQAVEEADWVFAGPGSPSYAVREWTTTRLPGLLRDRLAGAPGRATVFSSAAAVTLGSHAIPVYEIYKAGFEPHWVDGLDLLTAVDVPAVVIPHYDNAEGGTHDTRFCYLGEARLRRMEADLPDGSFVLGVDEHTAAIVDLSGGSVRVTGRGGVTIRVAGESTVFGEGTHGLEDLLAVARGEAAGAGGAPVPAVDTRVGTEADDEATDGAAADDSPLREEVRRLEHAFDAALDAGDALAATEAVLDLERTVRDWAADTLTGTELDDAVEVLRRLIVRLGRVAGTGLHDHRDLLAPHVEVLLELRRDFRAAGEYDRADRIRDELVSAGVEVRDTADGVEWEYPED
jgi:cyanophycinase-like exopeptidase